MGTNFHRLLPFLESTAISTLHYLQLSSSSDAASSADERFPRTRIASIGVDRVKELYQ